MGAPAASPSIRYFYSRPRPAMKPGQGTAGPARGAAHSAEIEYAMGNLPGNAVFDWTPDDDKVSETMQGYFANFVKTGDPNGGGLPAWPAVNKGDAGRVLQLDVVDGRATGSAAASLPVPRSLLCAETRSLALVFAPSNDG